MSVETLKGRRPPQVLENPVPDDSRFFENLLQLRTLYRLRQHYANLPPEDHILPPTEVQESSKSIVQHLGMVETCQKEFDLALGSPRKAGEMLAYNPVFDRVNFELATTEEEMRVVKMDMIRELETNLRERYHSPLSVVKYLLDGNGLAFSEDDQSEPVDVKFQRGALYRIQHGSDEPERELQTVKAGTEAKNKLADPKTALYSKVVVVSPPSGVAGTAYKDNFVDIYEADLDPGTGKRIIWMYRFASSLDSGEYKEAIGRLEGSGCLEPIFIDAEADKRDVYELFNQEFRGQKDTIKEEDFQEILKRSLAIRQNYIEVVCGKVFNPREIALAFNAVLNKADAIRREIISRGKRVLSSFRDLGRNVINSFKNIKEEVIWLGRQVVERVMAGCGLSGGFSIGGGLSRIGNLISFVSGMFNSLGGFFGGETGKKGKTCINCSEVNYCTRECYKCGGMLI